MKPSNNVENKTCWKSSANMNKVPAHSSLEPPVEYSQDQMPLTNQDSLRPNELSWQLQKYYAVPN